MFELEHNRRWLEVTRPIVEAFLHARFFLDMAVRYGKELEAPPTLLPNGWAALLYLYQLRETPTAGVRSATGAEDERDDAPTTRSPTNELLHCPGSSTCRTAERWIWAKATKWCALAAWAAVSVRRTSSAARRRCRAAELDELLARTRPRVCFFGHHHTRLDAEVAGVRCLGLNKGHYPGCLVAFEMNPGVPPGRSGVLAYTTMLWMEWQLLGEWPPKESRP